MQGQVSNVITEKENALFLNTKVYSFHGEDNFAKLWGKRNRKLSSVT